MQINIIVILHLMQTLRIANFLTWRVRLFTFAYLMLFYWSKILSYLQHLVCFLKRQWNEKLFLLAHLAATRRMLVVNTVSWCISRRTFTYPKWVHLPHFGKPYVANYCCKFLNKKFSKNVFLSVRFLYQLFIWLVIYTPCTSHLLYMSAQCPVSSPGPTNFRVQKFPDLLH